MKMLLPLPDPPPREGGIEEATEGVRKLCCVDEERKLALEPFISQCTSTSVTQARHGCLSEEAVPRENTMGTANNVGGEKAVDDKHPNNPKQSVDSIKPSEV